MSRAAQIVADYTTGRSFAYPHSAEEYLAMAYDDMAARMREAQQREREMRERYDSLIEERALEIARYTKVEVLPPIPKNPGVWTLRLDPMLYEVHMLSSHPTKWHPAARNAIVKAAGDVFAGIAMRACMSSAQVSQ
jgi:hypothetical protein